MADTSITWADVLLIAPELSTLSSGQQTAILAQVELQMGKGIWGANIDLGAVWLAAHLGTLTKRAGRAGPVTQEAVGQVSHSFGVPLMSLLNATVYGQEFERLLLNQPAARWQVA